MRLNAQLPSCWIASVVMRTPPIFRHIYRNGTQWNSLIGVISIHQCALGSWLDAAVNFADQVQHDLPVIVQLQAEPIPPDIVVAQGGRAKFMIHPRITAHMVGLAVDSQRALRSETADRVVITGILWLRAFLTQSMIAIEHRPFRLDCSQVYSDWILRRLEMHGF